MSYRVETQCQHLEGRDINEHFGAISTPIYQNATFAHRGFGMSSGYDYSRVSNPTREVLEKKVAQLEHGTKCLAFSSGMAAISCVISRYKPGDEIIICDDLYGGSIRLFEMVEKTGVRFVAVNLIEDDLDRFVTKATKAVYIETPTNPLMGVLDISKLSERCRSFGLELIVDNTFMSPFLQNPLDLGADIVIHSGTKYLSGHHDSLSGFTIVSDEKIAEELEFIYKTVGYCLSPFEAWLVERGIKTLALRMERSCENAAAVVSFLKENPHVTRVLYPGLKEHQGYDIMLKQARGFGAMITFDVPSKEFAAKVLENLKLILFAESLGGTETLITHPAMQTHHDIPEEIRIKRGIYDTTLRLSVGIENIDDILQDLEKALSL